jgi:hypothetical protein
MEMRMNNNPVIKFRNDYEINLIWWARLDSDAFVLRNAGSRLLPLEGRVEVIKAPVPVAKRLREKFLK